MLIKDLGKFIKQIVKSPNYIPTLIWGPPGVGKSAMVKQVADELGMDFIDLRLSLLNPVDLRGLPTVDKEKGRAKWLPPEFLPNGSHGKHGILFMDEMNLAPASVMHAGYQLILDRRLGNYVLPDGWVIIAAGNRAKDKANVTNIPAPLANRFCHVELEADVDLWLAWAINHGIDPIIVGFLSKFPQHFMKLPEKLHAGEQRFPTPRSWEMASNLFKAGLDVSPAVGDGPGAEFYQYAKVWDKLPDVDAILAGKLHDVPDKEELDIMWAISAAILAKVEPKQVPAALEYVFKMPKEFQVMVSKMVSDKSDEHHVELVNSKQWEKWVVDNEEFINQENEE